MDNASKAPENGFTAETANISNTGQRVRGIAVVALALVVVVVGIVWFERSQKEIKRHEEALLALAKAHSAGYDKFWITAKIDVKKLKSNLDFHVRMKQILKDAPVLYGRHIVEKGLPLLDDGVRAYRSLALPAVYADDLVAVIHGMEQLREAWGTVTQELLKWEGYLAGRQKLEMAADAWVGMQQVGMQQSKKDKYRDDAIRYADLLQCILLEESVVGTKGKDLETAILDSCRDTPRDWFRRVAYDCIPILAGRKIASEEGGADNVFRKGPGLDTTSRFGIEECLQTCRGSVEDDMIEKITLAWVNYVQVKNKLVGEVKSNLEKRR